MSKLLLEEGQLIQHSVQMYFQVCSYSTYPQHSGERYRTNGPLVYFYGTVQNKVEKGYVILTSTY